jgi:hypothetical protein
MSHIRVFTGSDRWMIQDEDGHVFWLDIWAVEAIAKVIRQVDHLGDSYEVTLKPTEGYVPVGNRKTKPKTKEAE